MTTASQRRGKKGEREAAELLSTLGGWVVRRRLLNGRRDDQGDLDGVPMTCVQVKAYADLNEAVTVGLPQLRRQRAIAEKRFGVLMVRRRGGRFVMVLDPDVFVDLVHAAGGLPGV